MTDELPQDWNSTDWRLVAYALAQEAGNPTDLDRRNERAFELIESIARMEGERPSTLIREPEPDSDRETITIEITRPE